MLPVPPGIGAADGTSETFLSWGFSLAYALREGLRRLYMLDDAEVELVLEEPWHAGQGSDRIQLTCITLIDPALGGAGYLPRAAEEFHLVAGRAIDHLRHEGCETACYRCLKDYRNQRHHRYLSWPAAMPVLEALAAAPPEPRPRETGDLDDPRPWLEAFAAGVGSPLELRFLRLFEEHGLAVEKQVPVAPAPAEKPISIADFAVPDRRVAIYVDGAAFHTGANLRRDRYIRDRLRNAIPPWTVCEFRSADLSNPDAVINQIRASM